MKILVLGLGNPILNDDGIGLRLAAEVQKRVRDPNVTVIESELGGLNLLDLLIGYDKVIILDAIQTQEGKPGQIFRLTEDSFEISHNANTTHGIDFRSMVTLGRQLGLDMPEDITIFAIEAGNISSFGTDLSNDVAKSIKQCVDMIIDELTQFSRNDL